MIRRFDKSALSAARASPAASRARAPALWSAGGAEEYETPASGRYEMRAGERFLLQSAGGGGYGDPDARDRAALARDVAEGYVTQGAAQKDYGDS